MDEILASIRRIIESGDERPDAAPVARSRPERPMVVERLDPEASANIVARLSPETETAFRPGDEDDLAAHLRREIEAEGLMSDSRDGPDRVAEAVVGTEQAERSDPEIAPLPTAQPEALQTTGVAEPAEIEPSSNAAGDGFSSSVAGTAGETTVHSAVDPEPMRAVDAPFVAANSDSRRMQDFRSAVLDDLTGDGQLEEAVSLVSGRTGELVGASFDELARAIREGELRSLEDMAQELLRPMLQDWLDDNLPKLVERLVREEIERVARGGRR